MGKLETTYIAISQPIGDFFLGCVNADKLRGAVRVSRRSESEYGQQRDLNVDRVKEISKFCNDPDATFPTAIILSVETSDTVEFKLEGQKLIINYEDTFGEIIDGQHRLAGIWESSCSSQFELPVVFMLDPTMEEKAYVFSIINSKQTKVNPSLIFDLFAVSTSRSPKKTCHELARALNSHEESPLKNRLKMLGRNKEGQEVATLSQGTFSKRILNLISKKPDEDSINIKKNKKLEYNDHLIFRKYFIDDQDDVILKILMNCFNALKSVFIDEWREPKTNILWKSTGFNAVIDSLPEMYKYCVSRHSFTQSVFQDIFEGFKSELKNDGKTLTSNDFGSGEVETKKLRAYIIQALDALQKSKK